MNQNVESQIVLDKFKLRWYQLDIWNKIEKEGYRKGIIILPRRAGKDITAWNLCIRQCIKRVCLVYYCLPTYGQGRKVIFDALTINGERFLDYVPKQLVDSINSSEMSIRFKNGSILQVIGADSYETSLVGTNPYAIVFSEWARCDPRAWDFARPILAANGGWCLFITTPFGKNHAYHMFKLAQEIPGWFTVLKTVHETNHIPEAALEEERRGMDPGLFAQEYECSFERGVEGSYYAKNLENLRQRGQICPVSWEPALEVHVAIDIGVNDATTLIFWQTAGENTIIRIIDCYSNNNLGLDHYAKYIQDKPYRYGKFFAPFDIKVREWGGGAITRYEKARQLGLNFQLLDQVGVMDGIENVWTHFPKFWIDSVKCRSLIDALENYRKEWDEEKNMFKEKPVKSWANHYADALRYMCLALHKTTKGLTSEEFDRQKAAARMGVKQLPPILDPSFRYQSYK